MGLGCGVECVEAPPRWLGRWGLFFESVLEATFLDFGVILGGFWEPKMVPKSIFGAFFSMFFFENGFGIDFESIFEGSKP